MKSKHINKSVLFVFLGLFMLFVVVFGGQSFLPAFAATTSYSSALDDLQKDETFNEGDYPDNADDASISVIQIAESTNKELFIYTYQPCQITRYLVATQINMSLSKNVDDTTLYNLKLISCNGVFCKYRVEGVTVGKGQIRYYNITSIYREWIEEIDPATGNTNVANFVAFGVGELWQACTENGKVLYKYTEIDVIRVLDYYVGQLRYLTGVGFLGFSKCDSHYVAFSTDKQIDKLIDATVVYSAEKYLRTKYFGQTVYKTCIDKVFDEQVRLSMIDRVTVGGGFLASTYSWNRIQSVDTFITTEKLKSSVSKKLKESYKWVLRFAETDYSEKGDGMVTDTHSWEVSEVTILRLEFETAGKFYNLGTVSNKQTGSHDPDNTNQNETLGFFAWLASKTGLPKWFWYVLLVIIILSIALPVLSLIFPAFGAALKVIFTTIWKCIVWFFKKLWWLISLPFQWIFKKKKAKSGSTTKSKRKSARRRSKK